jgi:hypothetical protein
MAKTGNSGAANLIPPKKGEVRNPNGRPKGVPNTATRLKRLLELEQEITNPVNGQKEMFSVAEQMDLAMINRARKGDVRAYQALVDRLEGKPKQSVDMNVDGEINIALVEFIDKKPE